MEPTNIDVSLFELLLFLRETKSLSFSHPIDLNDNFALFQSKFLLCVFSLHIASSFFFFFNVFCVCVFLVIAPEQTAELFGSPVTGDFLCKSDGALQGEWHTSTSACSADPGCARHLTCEECVADGQCGFCIASADFGKCFATYLSQFCQSAGWTWKATANDTCRKKERKRRKKERDRDR
jgi:hypothetical protein